MFGWLPIIDHHYSRRTDAKHLELCLAATLVKHLRFHLNLTLVNLSALSSCQEVKEYRGLINKHGLSYTVKINSFFYYRRLYKTRGNYSKFVSFEIFLIFTWSEGVSLLITTRNYSGLWVLSSPYRVYRKDAENQIKFGIKSTVLCMAPLKLKAHTWNQWDNKSFTLMVKHRIGDLKIIWFLNYNVYNT